MRKNSSHSPISQAGQNNKNASRRKAETFWHTAKTESLQKKVIACTNPRPCSAAVFYFVAVLAIAAWQEMPPNIAEAMLRRPGHKLDLDLCFASCLSVGNLTAEMQHSMLPKRDRNAALSSVILSPVNPRKHRIPRLN
jgi:hypothetical protein